MATLNLAINPTQFVSGSEVAERALDGVKRAAREAQSAVDRMASRAAAGFSRVGATARGAFSAISGALSGFGSRIQNVAFQVGDFATQVGAGTSASIALGQQLPQLLGGFGALGAVLGAVVAIGVPLASAFFRGAEGASAYADAIETLREETSDLALETERLLRGLETTEEVLVQNRIRELEGERLVLIERIESANGRNARALELQLAALERKIQAESDFLKEVEAGRDAHEAAARVAGELSDTLAGADMLHLVNQADDLTTALNGALGVSREMAMLIQRTANPTGSGANGTGPSIPNQGPVDVEINQTTGLGLEEAVLPPAARRPAGRSGSSGVSEIDRTREAYDRLLASMDPVIAAQRELTSAQETINRAQEEGIITAEQAASAYELAEARYQDIIEGTTQSAESLSEVANATRGTLGELFDSIRGDSADAARALEDLAFQLAKMALFSGLGNIFPGAFGSGGFLSFDGGGFTGSGPRTGGIDGRGGFPAILHPNETVVDHTRTQDRGGMNVEFRVVNNAPGAEISQRQEQGPDGRQVLVAEVNRAVGRGELRQSMGSEFGLRPSRVSR